MSMESVTNIARNAMALLGAMKPESGETAETYQRRFEVAFFAADANACSTTVRGVYQCLRTKTTPMPEELNNVQEFLKQRFPEKTEHVEFATMLAVFTQLKLVAAASVQAKPQYLPPAVAMPNPFAPSGPPHGDDTIRGDFMRRAATTGNGEYVRQMDAAGNRFRTTNSRGFTTETILGPAASRHRPSPNDPDDETLFSDEYWADAHHGVFRMDEDRDDDGDSS